MTDPLTDAELAEIEARAEKATSGPWLESFGSYVLSQSAPTKICQTDDPWIKNDNKEADADFIAHARDDVPRLLETVRALQEEVRGLRKKVEELREGAP